MLSMVKRLMVGRPLATEEQEHQKLPKWARCSGPCHQPQSRWVAGL